MRRFLLERVEDETGISGSGWIAEGVQFTNGLVSLTWRTAPGGLEHGAWSSVATYPTLAMVEKVHGHGGKTLVRFIDETGPPHELSCPQIISVALICDCGMGLKPTNNHAK